MNTIANLGLDNLDRRKKKTHQAIQNAFIELLAEKNIDEISVSELTERADVNRKTFYNNYTSVYDVFDEIKNGFFTYVFSQLPENVTINNKMEIYPLLYDINKAFEVNKYLFNKITANPNKSLIITLLHNHLLPYITKCLKIYQISDAVIPYVCDFIVFGLSGLYHQWAKDDSLTVKQLSMLSYNLIISALHLENYSDIV